MRRCLTLRPRQQLLGQHRECCALRGKGWNRKHATVNYVFSHSPYKLYQYHVLVMAEMVRRGYKPSVEWLDKNHRGKGMSPHGNLVEIPPAHPIYPEHHAEYLKECLDNLAKKNVMLL